MKIEYKNLYTHFVFTTYRRQSFISEKNRIRIEKYITGIVQNHASKMYAIFANPEHMHFLVSRSPSISENRLASIIEESTEKFILDNQLVQGNFRWQKSGSAFSVSKSDVDKVCKYILNQAEHHKKETYEEEYKRFVKFYQTGIREIR